MALLRPLQHGLTSFSSEAEILHAVRESAILLFGPGQLAFLLVQPDTATLSGAGISAQPGILQRLEIPLIASHCLAAAAALEDRPRSTFETGLSERIPLIDTQITRALGSEGVLYLPLTGRTTGLGVIAFGISAAHHLRLHPPPAGDEVATIISRGNAAVAAMGSTQDPGAGDCHRPSIHFFCRAPCQLTCQRSKCLCSGQPSLCSFRACCLPCVLLFQRTCGRWRRWTC